MDAFEEGKNDLRLRYSPGFDIQENASTSILILKSFRWGHKHSDSTHLEHGFICRWPACEVYHRQSGTGLFRSRVLQVSGCLLPCTAPEVEAEYKHPFCRRITNLKTMVIDKTLASFNNVESMSIDIST